MNEQQAMSERLGSAVQMLESERRLDAAVSAVEPFARRLDSGPAGPVLRGEWLGHAVHPMLTDLPIGFWTSSFVLDLVGGKRSRPASQRLVALGLLSLLPTAAAGAVDWAGMSDQRNRRVGVVHAAANTIAGLLYLQSWRARRKGGHMRGVALGFAGAGVASLGGFLGGHLAFGSSADVADRGEPNDMYAGEDEHVLGGAIGA